jgi:ligand-binding sensor domain-containing protein
VNLAASSRLQAVVACLALGALVVAGAAPAQNSAGNPARHADRRDEVTLGRFHQDFWSTEEGAPSLITAITQTPDGLLWLGAEDGLWRFDGMSFEHLTGPDIKGTSPFGVSSLFVSRKGELWIGFAQSAGVSRYVDGRVEDMKLPRPPLIVTNILEGPDGAIYAEWGGVSGRLWRWKEGKWQSVEDLLGLPPGFTLGLVATREGSILAPVLDLDQRKSRIARLAPGSSRFRMLDGTYQFARLNVDRSGQLWVSDRDWLQRYGIAGSGLKPLGPVYPLPRSSGMRFLSFDGRGGAWSGSWSSPVTSRLNLAKAKSGNAIETYRWPGTAETDGVRANYTDAHGTVWVAESRGLLRFRLADISMEPTVTADNVGGVQLVSSKNGIVYAASHGKLYRLQHGAPARHVLDLAPDPIFCSGKADEIVLLQRRKVYSLSAQGHLRYIKPAPLASSACALDAAGNIWLRGYDGSAWRYEDGKLRELPDLKARVKGGILGLSANTRGEVAVPLDDETVAVFSGSRKLIYRLPSLGGAQINGVSPGLDGFVAFTAAGLVRLAQGHAVRLDPLSAPWTRRVTTLVETSEGEVWFSSFDGLSRVRSSDLQAAFGHPDKLLPRRLFDGRDGLAGTSQRLGPVGQKIALDGDGRIWAVRTAGLASIDPRSISADRAPPNVVFRLLTTDNGTFRDPRSVTLAAGTRSVRLAFSATGTLRPDLVRIRYRLENVDSDWIDAGQRRAAGYANLGPGKYRFVVTATSDGGGTATRSLSFDIRPTFLESWYFKLLCGVAFFALMGLGYRLRIAAVSRSIGARLAERHDERERIARELHDTLLQSVQALLLDFRLAAASLRSGGAGSDRLDGVIEHAEAVIAEGRDRVYDLRAHREPDTLEGRLRIIAAQTGLKDDVELNIVSYGVARPLIPAVSEEIARIATEALFNISRHAKAGRVDILVNYLQTMLTISLVDDGVGIDHSVIQAGRKPGHFGLVGMQERAKKLKGQMLLDRGPQGGAEVTLVIPAASAFQGATGPLSRLWQTIRSLLRS